jgi:hypothetical protein
VCLVGEPIEHGLAESGVGEDLGASHEKGGKDHALPCHHNLEQALAVYIDGAGLADDPKGPLFRTIGRGTGQLTRTSLPQANAHAMIRRRARGQRLRPRSATTAFAPPASRLT